MRLAKRLSGADHLPAADTRRSNDTHARLNPASRLVRLERGKLAANLERARGLVRPAAAGVGFQGGRQSSDTDIDWISALRANH